MSVIRIGSIVEGHSEVESLPILLSRIARSIDPCIALALPEPVRVPRDRFLSSDKEILRAVRFAADRAEHGQPVLILIDSEGKCPAELGQTLLRRAQVHCPGRPMGCVIAHQGVRGKVPGRPRSVYASHFELVPRPSSLIQSQSGAPKDGSGSTCSRARPTKNSRPTRADKAS